MNYYLLPIFLLIVFTPFAQNSNLIRIGSNKAQINTEATKYQIDPKIEVFFESNINSFSSSMTNYLCFNNTVIFIQKWNDKSLYDKESTLISQQVDSTEITSLQKYFKEFYNAELNYTDGVTGIVELKDVFGLACGEAGLPRGSGKKYLNLRTSDLSYEQKHNYLTSINPVHGLIGYLLLSTSKTSFETLYKTKIEQNQFRLSYCNGCGRNRSKTIAEIIKN
jgi:hypothetical protein